ncbi:MAG: phosphoribosyl-ATP diphosphatase [Clostridiales bacterium]|jgi:phosphoribosyl-ATP pyrophosphohydrolase|nr:phosphoribosyl-ATP diphosphatase [Clostridiales bacterium]
MGNTIKDLFAVIEQRKEDKIEGSYTCYLFEKGIDKILKKCGEECTEMVIAAKNENREDIVNETCDLIYHILVMLVELGVGVEDIEEELVKRTQKQLNLKKIHVTNKDS